MFDRRYVYYRSEYSRCIWYTLRRHPLVSDITAKWAPVTKIVARAELLEDSQIRKIFNIRSVERMVRFRVDELIEALKEQAQEDGRPSDDLVACKALMDKTTYPMFVKIYRRRTKTHFAILTGFLESNGQRMLVGVRAKFVET